METVVKSAIYTRISDARNGDAAGVDRQEADARKLAKLLGWKVVEVFTENDVSAFKRKKIILADGRIEYRVLRPRFRELLDKLQSGSFTGLVVYDLDRVARDPRDLEDLIDLRDHQGIQVRSVTGSLRLDSDADVTMARVMVAIANKSSRDTGRRVSRAAQDRAAAGRFNGGKRRFGYSPDCKELIPNEAEAVKWAYEQMRKGGTLEAISREWKKRELMGPLGAPLIATTVRQILLRPMNGGLASYKGEIVGKTNFPAIVSEDIYREVKAILNDPSRRTTKGRPPVSLLAPFLFCAICGGKMGSRNRFNADRLPNMRRISIYSCRAGHASRQKTQLDEAISGVVVEYLKRNSAQLGKPAKSSKKISAAVLEAGDLMKRRDALASIAASGDLAPQDFARAAREIDTRLKALEPKIQASIGNPSSATIAKAPDIEKAWAGYSLEKKRAIIRELIERIEIGRGTPHVFSMDNTEIIWAGDKP